jgi:hypothetical protein
LYDLNDLNDINKIKYIIEVFMFKRIINFFSRSKGIQKKFEYQDENLDFLKSKEATFRSTYDSPTLPDDFDFNKNTILLLDDNAGVLSFLKDDIITISTNFEGFDVENYNILAVGSKYAGFMLIDLLKEYELHIEFAILDITLGGTVLSDNGSITLDGVDVYTILKEYSENLKYRFFTGNHLNMYEKRSKSIVNKFKESSGEDIRDKIILKGQNNISERLEEINKLLQEK